MIKTTPTQALPLTQGIDNQLSFLMLDYFLNQNEWTSQVFQDAQYSYNRIDMASIQMPGLLCYPLHSNKTSFGYYQSGVIVLELKMLLPEVRNDLAQQVTQIANLLQLINLNGQLMAYCQSKMFGLHWLGKECKTDYSQVWKKESSVKLYLDFKVDLFAYQQGLEQAGFSLESPDQQIYGLAQQLSMNIKLISSEGEQS